MGKPERICKEYSRNAVLRVAFGLFAYPVFSFYGNIVSARAKCVSNKRNFTNYYSKMLEISVDFWIAISMPLTRQVSCLRYPVHPYIVHRESVGFKRNWSFLFRKTIKV